MEVADDVAIKHRLEVLRDWYGLRPIVGEGFMGGVLWANGEVLAVDTEAVPLVGVACEDGFSWEVILHHKRGVC